MKNRMLWKGYILGVHLIASSVVFAAGGHNQPILLVPVAPAPSGLPFPPPSPAEQFQELPYSSVSFRWNNNNPEAQIDKIRFSMRETIAYGSYVAGDDVGLCKWRTFYLADKEQTSFESSECQGGELKPNQWYKWILMLEFVDGRSLGKSAWFKTGDKMYRVSISVEIDKMVGSTWDWLTIPIERDGKSYTFKSIYKTAGIDMEIDPNPGSLIPAGGDATAGLTLEELHALATANRKEPWKKGLLYVAIVSKWLEEPTTGGYAYGANSPIVIDFAPHETFIFVEVIAELVEKFNKAPKKAPITLTTEELSLQVLVHELGHDFYLQHEDSDKYEGPLCSHAFECAGRKEITGIFGTTIMTPHLVLGLNEWLLEWSASSLTHFYAHPLYYWKPPIPGQNVPAWECHRYPK